MPTTTPFAVLLLVPVGLLGCGGKEVATHTLNAQFAGSSTSFAVHSAEGNLAVGDRTMAIRGAFGTWNSSGRSLDIALLPFEPTEQEARALVGKSFLFFDEAKNPDPASFEKCPYAWVRFRYKQVSGTPELAAADAITFEFHNFHPEWNSTTLNLPMTGVLSRALADCRLTLTADSGGEAVVVLEGSRDVRTAAHSWTIDVRAPVFVR